MNRFFPPKCKIPFKRNFSSQRKNLPPILGLFLYPQKNPHFNAIFSTLKFQINGISLSRLKIAFKTTFKRSKSLSSRKNSFQTIFKRPNRLQSRFNRSKLFSSRKISFLAAKIRFEPSKFVSSRQNSFRAAKFRFEPPNFVSSR